MGSNRAVRTCRRVEVLVDSTCHPEEVHSQDRHSPAEVDRPNLYPVHHTDLVAGRSILSADLDTVRMDLALEDMCRLDSLDLVQVMHSCLVDSMDRHLCVLVVDMMEEEHLCLVAARSAL